MNSFAVREVAIKMEHHRNVEPINNIRQFYQCQRYGYNGNQPSRVDIKEDLTEAV